MPEGRKSGKLEKFKLFKKERQQCQSGENKIANCFPFFVYYLPIPPTANFCLTTMTVGMTSIFVNSPADAFKFYTDTLGFIEEMFIPEADIAIVASPQGKNGTLLLLEPNNNPIAKTYQEAIRKAGFPVIVFFTDDIYKEFDRLTKLGVVFTKKPTETAYGIESIFDDNSGNWIQLLQREK